MDFSFTVCVWPPWYEKALTLFAFLYPVLAVAVAHSRLAKGRGSVVALAVLPMTAGAALLWFNLSTAADALGLVKSPRPILAGISEAATVLFWPCISTLVTLAGTLPYRIGGEERLPGNRLTSAAIAAPFVLGAAGLAYGVALSYLSAPPVALAVAMFGGALVGLNLLAIFLRGTPESRATAATVFVLTAVVAVIVWQYSHHFMLQATLP
ncbi:MAG TPA: hypothetical protein VH394_01560 [Thermoanaerobaculia bacterium]|jgi:uncharacterized MnhB-related membrane protein|nr:hypothetical protein [Thermoanaerobaculia bacterium]